MLVGVSGERKSSSDREFTKPFRQWTLQRLEEAKPKREPLLRRGSKREGLLTKIRHQSSGGNKTAISIEADIEAMKRASTRSSRRYQSCSSQPSPAPDLRPPCHALAPYRDRTRRFGMDRLSCQTVHGHRRRSRATSRINFQMSFYLAKLNLRLIHR